MIKWPKSQYPVCCWSRSPISTPLKYPIEKVETERRREAGIFLMDDALRDKTAIDDKQVDETALNEDHQMPEWRDVFLYFLMLGFINVGGPVAQITMMYNHMVERRRWLSDDRFVHVMGFCHMLPGPEALQLAIYVGYLKRRLLG